MSVKSCHLTLIGISLFLTPPSFIHSRTQRKAIETPRISSYCQSTTRCSTCGSKCTTYHSSRGYISYKFSITPMILASCPTVSISNTTDRSTQSSTHSPRSNRPPPSLPSPCLSWRPLVGFLHRQTQKTDQRFGWIIPCLML